MGNVCLLQYNVYCGLIRPLLDYKLFGALSEKAFTGYSRIKDSNDLRKVRQVLYTTEYTELQRLLSGVHSVMRVKSVLAGEGGGCTPTKLQRFLNLRYWSTGGDT
jgi:hypothetical protein